MFGQAAAKSETQIEFTEKRAERRHRALKTGNVLFNGGYNSYGCTIRNMTDAGVMVEMESTGGIPSEFDFRIKDDTKKYKAQVIWREAKRMGLQYI